MTVTDNGVAPATTTVAIEDYRQILADRDRYRAELAAARDEVASVTASLNAARTDTQVARNDRMQIAQELDRFKELVRETAISKAEEHDWCSVIDGILDELGLEPRTRTYRVELNVSYTVVVEVTASDEDQARDEIDEADRRTWVNVSSPIQGYDLLESNVRGTDIEVSTGDVEATD